MTETDLDELLLNRSPTMVRQMAADAIRNAILKGTLKPGQRLVEATLAKHMGVSRPSLREALMQLAAEKLVTITPNRGPAVATIRWEEAQHIYEVRALLEGEAIASFASRASAQNIEDMRQSLRDFQRAIAKKDITRLLDTTAQFYETVFKGCGNSIIGEILGGLNARVSYLRARSMSRPGRSKHSLVEMTDILDAIAAGHAAKARRAAETHVSNAAIAAKAAFHDDAATATLEKKLKAT
jgi:GntR family transcriptional regulator, trigonelline degradation regulator